MFGAPALFSACKKHGIKGVIGMEIYEAEPHEFQMDRDGEVFKITWAELEAQGKNRYFHLTLWALNEIGWKNLCALHRISWSQDYCPVSRSGKADKPLVDRATLAKHSEGIAVGLGCIASKTNQALIKHQNDDVAYETAKWYVDTFPGRVVMEIMANVPDQQMLIRRQRKLAGRLGIPVMVSNDVHYCLQSDGIENGPHHALVKSRAFKKADDGANEDKSSDKSDDTFGAWYGCLAADTRITTNRGAVPISDVVAGDLVMHPNGWREVNAVWNSGVKETFELTLEDGVQVIASANHRFLGDQGYKTVDDLRVGDRLKVGYEVRTPTIMALAATMTDGAKGDQVPGWAVAMRVVRNHVVDGQGRSLQTTDATGVPISLSNALSELVVPGEDGIVHVRGSLVRRDEPTRLTRIAGDEYCAFFFIPKIRADNGSNGLAMNADEISDGPDRFARDVQAEDFGLSDRVGMASVGPQAVLAHKSAEDVFRMSQSKRAPNAGIGVSERVEVSDILGTLPELFDALDRVDSGPVTGVPFPITVPSVTDGFVGESSAGATRHGVAASTEAFGRFNHKKIVSIQSSGAQATYDLNVNGGCFLANGVFSHNSDGFFMKSAAEMMQMNGIVPQDLLNTTEFLLNQVSFDFDKLPTPKAPIAPIPAQGENAGFDLWLKIRSRNG